MPYIYVEELEEGVEAADVRTADEYHALELNFDTMVGERDMLQALLDSLEAEKDSLESEKITLANELDDAKTKFANAFLSSPQKMKENNSADMKREETATTFATLFSERNINNAN